MSPELQHAFQNMFNVATAQAVNGATTQFQQHLTPPSAILSSRREPKPFRGDLKSVWSVFAAQMERFALLESYSDAKLAAVFPDYLDLTAKSKYNEILHGPSPPTTWKDHDNGTPGWKTVMGRAFPASRGMILRIEEFRKMRTPENGTTIDAFAAKLSEEALLAFPDPVQRDSQLKIQFLLGVYPKIRSKIVDAGERAPEKFQECFERAQEVELALYRDEGVNPFIALQNMTTFSQSSIPHTTVAASNFATAFGVQQALPGMPDIRHRYDSTAISAPAFPHSS